MQQSLELEAFEMWTYCRMFTNSEVLRRTEILHEVKKGKLQYLGHVMRGQRYEILQLIIQGKIVGRSVGRRTISWLRNLKRKTRMIRRHVLSPIQSRSFKSKDSQPPSSKWYMKKMQQSDNKLKKIRKKI